MSTLPSFFNGKHVLVTGASTGIGLSAARLIVANGGTVTIIARGADKLAAAAATLGDRAHVLALDVTDAAAVRARVGAHIEAHPVDMLINNAGAARPGRFVELEDQHFHDMMNLNYFGTVHMCRTVVPHLIARKSGHILNVASMLGVLGIYGYSAYAASKFAVVGFSQCLRAELWPHGIKVSVCLPPNTDTPGLVEENKTKPKETHAIEGKVKTMSPDAVAEAMLRAMAAGTYEIVPGFDGWSTTVAARLLPGVTRMVCDSAQKKAATV